MDWKNVVLFLICFVLGAGFMFFFSMIYWSSFFWIFFVLYVIFLVLIFREYSHAKLGVIILILLIYALLIMIPFPKCYAWHKFNEQDCTCIGIEKQVRGILDADWTQCIGIATDYHCYELNPRDGSRAEEIECS